MLTLSHLSEWIWLACGKVTEKEKEQFNIIFITLEKKICLSLAPQTKCSSEVTATHDSQLSLSFSLK